MKPTHEYLKGILDYNPEIGTLTWKIRSDVRQHWNDRYAGHIAGSKRPDGYINLSINKKQFLAHQICYFISTGIWVEEIDHDNQIKNDNRLINLIPKRHADNMKNQKKRTTNTSGITGVFFNSEKQKWTSKIQVSGQQIFLGNFENIDDAIDARRTAEYKHNFHPNHGI